MDIRGIERGFDRPTRYVVSSLMTSRGLAAAASLHRHVMVHAQNYGELVLVRHHVHRAQLFGHAARGRHVIAAHVQKSLDHRVVVGRERLWTVGKQSLNIGHDQIISDIGLSIGHKTKIRPVSRKP